MLNILYRKYKKEKEIFDRKKAFKRILRSIERGHQRKLLLFSDVEPERELINDIRNYFLHFNRWSLEVVYKGVLEKSLTNNLFSYYDDLHKFKSSFSYLSEDRIDIQKLKYLSKKSGNAPLNEVLSKYNENDNYRGIQSILWEAYEKIASSGKTTNPVRFPEEISDIVKKEGTMRHLMFLYKNKRIIYPNLADNNGNFSYKKIVQGFAVAGIVSEPYNLPGRPSNFLCFSLANPSYSHAKNTSKFIMEILDSLYGNYIPSIKAL